MSEGIKETLNIKLFLDNSLQKIKEGMTHRDAIQLSAVETGGDIARLVSRSINKYQEAVYEKTELSKQPNVDECALASMGKLWHGENFEGNTKQMHCTPQETFLDAIYFILKYAKSQNALEDALSANDTVCGDKTARRAIIEALLK